MIVKRVLNIFCLSLLYLSLVCGTGCGHRDRGNLPDVYPVTGTVTMDGKPVADAVLSFQLMDGTRGAIGQTDSQGRYTLTTFHSEDGAVPGEYRISVMKFSTPPPDYPVRKSEDDENYIDFVPKNLLPKKYSDAQKSGLTATVDKERNVIDISLD